MEDTSEKKQKEFEEELRRKDEEINRLRQEVEKLKKDKQNLEEEIKHLKKPKWAKPNKKELKNDKNKLGPKKGHKANPRKPVEKTPDQEVVWVPELCVEGHGVLPFPTKWHEHVQIDIPVHHQTIVTKHVVGWSYCKGCKKYHSAVHEKLSYSKYGPNLHSYVTYLKFDLGMTLGKI